MRLSTCPPLLTWRRSPDARSSSLTVRSARKPWVTPSTKRTVTGSAEAWPRQNRTVNRTSKESVAFLVNNPIAEEEICVPTVQFPGFRHRALQRLLQSTELLKAFGRSPGLIGDPKFSL